MSISYEKRDYTVPDFYSNDDDDDDPEEEINNTTDNEDDFFHYSYELLCDIKRMTVDDAVHIFDKCSAYDFHDFLLSFSH
jgi:hypothetical protein